MAATIRATATTGIIRATAITPIMITDIIRAPIIDPTPIVPIPITIGAIGIEDGGRLAQLVRAVTGVAARLAASFRPIEGEMAASARLGSTQGRAGEPGSATHRQIGALRWPCKQASA